MDDTLLFIPPCCVDKKLPRAVMQAPHRALTFYTHGDVTMEKFYRAVSYMVIDAHVMVIAMPVVEPETLVFVQQCFERKWITHLVLSTSRDCQTLLQRYLSEYNDRILYTNGSDVTDLSSHLVLYNADRALVLNGPMYERPFNGTRLVAYNMVFYPNHSLSASQHDWGNPLRNVLLPDVLRHRKVLSKEQKMALPAALSFFIHLEFPPYDE